MGYTRRMVHSMITRYSCLSEWKICGSDSYRKWCLYPLTWLLYFTYHVINGSRVITVHTLQYSVVWNTLYLCIQHRVSNWTVFWHHYDRKSSFFSFLSVPSTWMRTYKRCDDVIRRLQVAFAYISFKVCFWRTSGPR